EHDVFCSPDGKRKSYCTPEAYRGETCWLFHNRGDGTFEDVTANSGIFDSSSKSLGSRCSTTNPMVGPICWLRTTRSRTSSIATSIMALSRTWQLTPDWRSVPKGKLAPAWE